MLILVYPLLLLQISGVVQFGVQVLVCPKKYLNFLIGVDLTNIFALIDILVTFVMLHFISCFM